MQYVSKITAGRVEFFSHFGVFDPKFLSAKAYLRKRKPQLIVIHHGMAIHFTGIKMLAGWNKPNITPMEAMDRLQTNLDQEEMHFLLQIKKELSLDNSQEAVKLVASVLQALRQTLSLKDADELLNQLPDFLKLAFAANWERTEQLVKIAHLDEFVSLVMDRDHKAKKGLFKNEVQTLTVVILTLKKIQKIINLEDFDGISPVFKQELRDVSTEAAA